MKEQNPSLNRLSIKPEPKRRFDIKKILILSLVAYVIYYIIGMVTNQLFWEPNTDCAWIKDKKPSIICSKKCGQESLACRQSCFKEDQECYRKCYDNAYLPCYDTCYESTTSQIKKCETSTS
ncbi:hypothetical protein CONCODRAFT_12995 [Conidiobolus coronatus NRRL 28638]|uniref:Transmembrane protein n=1 Tax=Conidiobolus coronatus (strain ATCC 28846 / CBS 209.66 / NRRL 28638) TaxID=796925 RepID=A0A137NRQ1_CONC2|nr:hypothetical protein CONCODRAFT_12995 [Conidiobolus coronatus NRRL 28638]|eukprot:KXN65418.1 hypothetical protein CONCODRAFT_12995 [Conidiobolus coronatus NRRL 28638]